jgi:RNA polymerase sigma factor (sigma-70 family)
MGTAQPFPDMETGYRQYHALFYDVLARLARQGFSVQPEDSEDLIHEFFAEVWGDLSGRYDPNHGSPPSYVYGAFLRFARSRIIRLKRWQQRLKDLDDMASNVAQPGTGSLVESLVYREKLDAIHDALTALPTNQRMLLLDYFQHGPRSERLLSRSYRLTRYSLRQRLIEALGRVAIHVGERGNLTDPDWHVAVALWYEGRTVEEAALRLGRAVPDVREARDRIIELLSRALHGTAHE